jgi:hypothetical protein
MKRKVKERRRPNRPWDPRKDLSADQLAAFGAMRLAWNDTEAVFDVLFCVVTMVPHILWREIATRINGIEGKREIIKIAVERRWGIREFRKDPNPRYAPAASEVIERPV